MLLSMQASQQETLSGAAVPRHDNAPLRQAHPMMITIGLGLIGLGIIVLQLAQLWEFDQVRKYSTQPKFLDYLLDSSMSDFSALLYALGARHPLARE